MVAKYPQKGITHTDKTLYLCSRNDERGKSMVKLI